MQRDKKRWFFFLSQVEYYREAKQHSRDAHSKGKYGFVPLLLQLGLHLCTPPPPRSVRQEPSFNRPYSSTTKWGGKWNTIRPMERHFKSIFPKVTATCSTLKFTSTKNSQLPKIILEKQSIQEVKYSASIILNQGEPAYFCIPTHSQKRPLQKRIWWGLAPTFI